MMESAKFNADEVIAKLVDKNVTVKLWPGDSNGLPVWHALDFVGVLETTECGVMLRTANYTNNRLIDLPGTIVRIEAKGPTFFATNKIWQDERFKLPKIQIDENVTMPDDSVGFGISYNDLSTQEDHYTLESAQQSLKYHVGRSMRRRRV